MSRRVVVQHRDIYDEGQFYLSLYKHSSHVHRHAFFLDQYLPLPNRTKLVGNHCDGLYIMTDVFHKSISIFNFTTREIKPLTLPKSGAPYDGSFDIFGIGRCPGSNAYKVLLSYTHNHRDEYPYFDHSALLYSSDTHSFKNIECPRFIANWDGVYLAGKCYWYALILKPLNGLEHKFNEDRSYVLSFNFRTEKFTIFPLPPLTGEQFCEYDIVEYGDKLGAIGHFDPHDGHAHVWVRDKRSWKEVGQFYSKYFERALALKDDGWLSFIERPCLNYPEHSVVEVFDVISNKCSARLHMRCCRGKINVFPYVNNTDPLPFEQSIPMIEEEEEEEEHKKKKNKKSKKKKKNKKKKNKKSNNKKKH